MGGFPTGSLFINTAAPRDIIAWDRVQTRAHLVENVRSVGAGQHHDALSGGEPIHFHQQLVQGVLPLVIATGKATAATCTSNGVDLICAK